VALHKQQPIVEVVDWFGKESPSSDAIRRAKRFALAKATLGIEAGALRFVLMDSPMRVPKGLYIVGYEPKVARKGKVPHLGMWWIDIKKTIVIAAATQSKKDPKVALRRQEAKSLQVAATRAGLTPRLFALQQDAREIATMWRKDEYDNTKDVVFDLIDMLPKLGSLPKEMRLLTNIKVQVLKELSEMSNEPAFAADASNWTRRLLAI
jgi:hypothetical protein